MSLGQFLMAGGWLLAANLRSRTLQTIRNPVFIFPATLYLIQLVGLWNTSNVDWGLHDLRIKLPILLLPFLLVAGPGMDLRFKVICLRTLFGGVLAATSIGIVRVLIGEVPLHDFRSLSPFISHIRLSLLLVFSIAAIVLVPLRNPRTGLRVLQIVIILWFLFYLVLLQSLTGLTILAFIILVGAGVQVLRSDKTTVRISMLLIVLVGGLSGVMLVRYIAIDSLKPEKPDPQTLKTSSELGSPYRNDIDQIEIENGRFVWTEYSEKELDSAWTLRSKIPLEKSDSSGRFPLATLMRYLTYLGYSKDAAGVNALTASQIHEIEQGYATPLHAKAKMGVLLRVKELAREYRTYHYTGFAQGHTFAQRLEYQRAALYLIRHQPWTGVGTGDLPVAYAEAYDRIGSTLDHEWRLRAHNQYLSLGVANGVGAMAWLFIMLSYLLIRGFRKRQLLQVVFLMIVACSFLTEDTLETQAGVTFFAFLCCLAESWKSGDSASVSPA